MHVLEYAAMPSATIHYCRRRPVMPMAICGAQVPTKKGDQTYSAFDKLGMREGMVRRILLRMLIVITCSTVPLPTILCACTRNVLCTSSTLRPTFTQRLRGKGIDISLWLERSHSNRSFSIKATARVPEICNNCLVGAPCRRRSRHIRHISGSSRPQLSKRRPRSCRCIAQPVLQCMCTPCSQAVHEDMLTRRCVCPQAVVLETERACKQPACEQCHHHHPHRLKPFNV
jgi:hypothetical protein